MRSLVPAALLVLGGLVPALAPKPAHACQVHGMAASCVCAPQQAVQTEMRTVRRYSVQVPVQAQAAAYAPAYAPAPAALLPAPAKVQPQPYAAPAPPIPSAQSFQPQSYQPPVAMPAPSAQYQQNYQTQSYQYQEVAPAPVQTYVEEVPVVTQTRTYSYGVMMADDSDVCSAPATYSVMPTGYGVGTCNQGVGFRSNGFRNNGFRSNGFQSSGFNSFNSGAVATGGGRVVISGRRVNLKKAQVQGLFNSGNDVEITGRRINFKKGIFN